MIPPIPFPCWLMEQQDIKFQLQSASAYMQCHSISQCVCMCVMSTSYRISMCVRHIGFQCVRPLTLGGYLINFYNDARRRT